MPGTRFAKRCANTSLHMKTSLLLALGSLILVLAVTTPVLGYCLRPDMLMGGYALAGFVALGLAGGKPARSAR